MRSRYRRLRVRSAVASFFFLALAFGGSAAMAADVSEAEPNDTCPGQLITCGDTVTPAALTPGGPGSPDIDYYQFHATAGEVITVGTDFLSDLVDTQITLYQGTSCDPADEIAFNNENPEQFSRIDIIAPVTGMYTACVQGRTPDQAGTYLFFTECSPPGPGDFCETALPLPCGAIDINSTTLGMLGSYNLPPGNACNGFDAPGLDAVYVITEPMFILDVVYDSSEDASIYLVTDCTDPVGSCVAGANDDFGSGPETLFFDNSGDVTPALPGPFYLIVDSFGFIAGEGGPYTLTGSLTCPPVATEASSWGAVKSRFD